MSIRTWVELNFCDPADQPCEQTVRNWVRSGAIRGEVIGRTYWIYEDWKSVSGDALVDEFVRKIVNAETTKA